MGPMVASAPRIIALILVAMALVTGKRNLVAKSTVDRIVIIIWIWTVFATIIADKSFSPQVSQMIGRGLDTVLMYFVVRLYITSMDALKGFARWLIIVSSFVGLLGILETTTSYSPYSTFSSYRLWDSFSGPEDWHSQYRYGLLRARGSTSVSIYFGISMLLVTGMLWAISKALDLGRIGRLAILLGTLGTLSSMSSGPWLACILMFVFGLYRYKPSLIRPSVYLLLLMSLFLEVASNRHFYNLIDYFVLDAQTAWYRSRLLEVAASHLSEFWLVGVGSNWPMHWGPMLDGRQVIDIVNHFLIVALYGGLLAMILYIASHYLAFSHVVKCRKSKTPEPLRIATFYLACVLLAIDFSCMTVSLYGPPLILSHILLGLIVTVSLIGVPNSIIADDRIN